MNTDALLDQVADYATRLLLADVCARVAALEAAPVAAGVTPGLVALPPAVGGPDALALALNGKLAAVLLVAGYDSPAAVAAASDDALLAVPGVNAKALKLIRERIKEG